MQYDGQGIVQTSAEEFKIFFGHIIKHQKPMEFRPNSRGSDPLDQQKF